jgi:hypothetical protein
MANVTTVGTNQIQITGLDADWSWEDDTDFIAGIWVRSIQFLPSAANDIMIIHDKTIDGADIFNTGPTGGTAPILEPEGIPVKMYPVIDISDCTFTTAANAKVIIDYV